MVFVPCLVRRVRRQRPWPATVGCSSRTAASSGLVIGTVVLLVLAFRADDRLDRRSMRSVNCATLRCFMRSLTSIVRRGRA